MTVKVEYQKSELTSTPHFFPSFTTKATRSKKTMDALKLTARSQAVDGGNDYADVAVLSNRALLELVTGFMIGYPRVVYNFAASSQSVY